MEDKIKQTLPRALPLAITVIITHIIWGTPFKLISEMNISKELLGKRSMRISVR